VGARMYSFPFPHQPLTTTGRTAVASRYNRKWLISRRRSPALPMVMLFSYPPSAVTAGQGNWRITQGQEQRYVHYVSDHIFVREQQAAGAGARSTSPAGQQVYLSC
jgi:hypothetical protein